MTFSSETLVKAVRKRHICNGCLRHIEAGQSAMRWAGMTDGEFGTCIYHLDCREAELAYNNDLLECQWGDDWYPIHDIDSDDWPWLIEAHPTVAARMGITAHPDADTSARQPSPREEQNPLTTGDE